jgi:hypothetical protein
LARPPPPLTVVEPYGRSPHSETGLIGRASSGPPRPAHAGAWCPGSAVIPSIAVAPLATIPISSMEGDHEVYMYPTSGLLPSAIHMSRQRIAGVRYAILVALRCLPSQMRPPLISTTVLFTGAVMRRLTSRSRRSADVRRLHRRGTLRAHVVTTRSRDATRYSSQL